jgi:hypothetical protein
VRFSGACALILGLYFAEPNQLEQTLAVQRLEA